jgi:hypothetical protein
MYDNQFNGNECTIWNQVKSSLRWINKCYILFLSTVKNYILCVVSAFVTRWYQVLRIFQDFNKTSVTIFRSTDSEEFASCHTALSLNNVLGVEPRLAQTEEWYANQLGASTWFVKRADERCFSNVTLWKIYLYYQFFIIIFLTTVKETCVFYM